MEGYQVFWNVNEQDGTISLALHVQTTGWVCLSLSLPPPPPAFLLFIVVPTWEQELKYIYRLDLELQKALREGIVLVFI